MAESDDGSGEFVRVVLRPAVKISTDGDVARARALHAERASFVLYRTVGEISGGHGGGDYGCFGITTFDGEKMEARLSAAPFVVAQRLTSADYDGM